MCVRDVSVRDVSVRVRDVRGEGCYDVWCCQLHHSYPPGPEGFLHKDNIPLFIVCTRRP